MNDEPSRRLTISDLIEEGGWQKPVAPPRSDARPGGLQKPQSPQSTANTPNEEKRNDSEAPRAPTPAAASGTASR